MIADERRGLADLLEGLDEAQWDSPSLCEGWTVRTVAGHLPAGWNISIPRSVVAIVRQEAETRSAWRVHRAIQAGAFLGLLVLGAFVGATTNPVAWE